MRISTQISRLSGAVVRPLFVGSVFIVQGHRAPGVGRARPGGSQNALFTFAPRGEGAAQVLGNDVFSFGMVMYELLVQGLPWTAEEAPARVMSHDEVGGEHPQSPASW